MRDYLFKPFIGECYDDGYQGCKTLVLGASHYCKEESFPLCQNHKECSDESYPFNDRCPYYKGKLLADSTIDEIENFLDSGSGTKSYQVFTDFMLNDNLIDTEPVTNLWNHFSFYNYYQRFAPTARTPDYNTYKVKFDEDMECFNKVLSEINPQLVIVWGKPVRQALKAKYGNSMNDLDEKNYNHELIIGNQRIIFCFFDHPSYPKFHSGVEEHHKYLSKAIEIAKWG